MSPYRNGLPSSTLRSVTDSAVTDQSSRANPNSSPPPRHAQSSLRRGRRRGRQEVRVPAGVAAGHPATAEVGLRILAAGGSAADAAVAATLACCVAESGPTGIGGGGVPARSQAPYPA